MLFMLSVKLEIIKEKLTKNKYCGLSLRNCNVYFEVAEVENVSQTCGIAVADHLLQFCGNCGSGFQCKFAVPSTATAPRKFSRPPDFVANVWGSIPGLG